MNVHSQAAEDTVPKRLLVNWSQRSHKLNSPKASRAMLTSSATPQVIRKKMAMNLATVGPGLIQKRSADSIEAMGIYGVVSPWVLEFTTTSFYP